MRVVVVLGSLARGGAERVVSVLSREWAKKHDVVVVLFSSNNQAYSLGGRVIDIRLPPVRYRLLKLVRMAARCVRLIGVLSQERPSLILSFMESANLPTVLAATLVGYRNRVRVSVRNNPSMIEPPYRAIIPLLYRVPERVVAPSDGVRKGLQDRGVPAARLLTIPNPVAVDAIGRPGAASPFPGSFILGVGRLSVQKGFDRLLQAFSNIELQEIHVVILGDGEQRSGLMRLAEELRVDARVHLPGSVADVGLWYQHAQCFVLTSHFEGWPNVLVEAMANGCPVVSFDCAYGPAEIIEHGTSGILVAQDDVVGLTREITRVLSDRELRYRLATASKSRAHDFSVERIAPSWLAERVCPDSGA